jgi:hypothetical protein
MGAAIQPYELLGAVCHRQHWRFYSGTIAEWILDYRAYDPAYDPSAWPTPFRNNLLTVSPDDAAAFQESMAPQEQSLDEVRALVQHRGTEAVPLSVVVDFDRRLFVNGYYDLAIEAYVPPGWQAVFDDPLQYLPEPLRTIWPMGAG